MDQNSGFFYDERYTRSGIYTTVYDAQNSSGVLSILENSPSYTHYVDTDSKKDDTMSSWNRQTLAYSLACQLDGRSRQYAIDTVKAGLASGYDDYG